MRYARPWLLALGLLSARGVIAEPSPWSLQHALDLPAWLTLSGETRLRYETLDRQWRSRGRGGDQILALRTTALLEAHHEQTRAGVEMIDARVFLDDRGTPLDTTQSASLDLLQAFVAFRTEHTLGGAVASDFRLGRQTLDLGSRRLIARNRYRNTINAFTGLHGRARGRDGAIGEGFIGSPVMRQPTDASALADNEAAFDEEDFGTLLAFAAWRSAPASGAGQLELYLIGLHESDAHFATRNRRLVTPGARWLTARSPGRFDVQIEAALQAGTARADVRATTREDLDHFAQFTHLELGYSFERHMAPHLSALFDYASGDRDPLDGNSERFDTLYGARRFDFGPTGIWGALQRANLVSPGLRLDLAPHEEVSLMAAWRGAWLASRRDAWVPARVTDPSGRAGRHIGQHLEFSASWTLPPGNLAVELGGAWLFAGRFPDAAPNGAQDSDSRYLYTQIVCRF